MFGTNRPPSLIPPLPSLTPLPSSLTPHLELLSTTATHLHNLGDTRTELGRRWAHRVDVDTHFRLEIHHRVTGIPHLDIPVVPPVAMEIPSKD